MAETANANAVNAKPQIIAELRTMQQADFAAGRKFQALAYTKVIKALDSMPGPVRTIDDITGIPGVGAKIRAKVEEILATGTLAAAARARAANPDLDAIRELQEVHGIGMAKAKTLVAAGIKSVEQLRTAAAANAKLLTAAQKTGLARHADSQARIPRAEMQLHEGLLLSRIDERKLQGTIVGSYRRGAADSGDIDFMMTLHNEPDEVVRAARLKSFVEELESAGYITDRLSLGPKKFMGYVKLPGEGQVHRRLDILMTPDAEYAYSILYFTGSKEFNIAFRQAALDRGYTLNEHGMVPTADAAPPPPMKKELDIFKFLKLRYVLPVDRKDGSVVEAARGGGKRKLKAAPLKASPPTTS